MHIKFRDKSYNIINKPDCFESEEDWEEYVRLLQSSISSDSVTDYFKKRTFHCRDCLKQLQTEMIAEKKCAHPNFQTDSHFQNLGSQIELLNITVL